ncbi:MAG: hypothetical protein KBD01_14000 [Acidobacteria bacterium]|nr:hypothetical protein [Acidobacteriota bacterium]
MNAIEQILQQFGDGGVEASFRVSGKTYHVFAYRSPNGGRPGIRWNLYEVRGGSEPRLRGLTFGIASGVREAMEDVVHAAEEHADTGFVAPVRARTFTFRPSPQD